MLSSTLRLFTNTVYMPLTCRLNRLLYKHKFEEAEKFALAFELDVEVKILQCLYNSGYFSQGPFCVT